ncbi:MAG TPA: hypothetical protein VKW08_07975 [Xanthobacteraceae bacterium]|jgi:hypothetical protein|nr:hypothetical protein [Xanthobacteraceae bacterium]
MSVVRFESRGEGREVALLGAIIVADIIPYPVGGKFYWSLRLPFCGSMARACSVDEARRQIAGKVDQWIEAADLQPRRAA